MNAQLIDGRKVAKEHLEKLKCDIAEWSHKNNRKPSLHLIIAGSDPASLVYINAKQNTCKLVGIESHIHKLPDTVSSKELRYKIKELNQNENVDGILVQLPLPSHLHALDVIETIDYRKDVDGFHPINSGRLMSGQPCYIPCTPQGIAELMQYYSITTKSKNMVIVGTSMIVGTPCMLMFSREKQGGKATVTLCHKYTKNLAEYTQKADILITCVGISHFITDDMVKQGVIVIDVGITRVASHDSPKGYKLTGDCHFETLKHKASWITPVPGGVGPMTVAMLMKNTVLAAKKAVYN